MGKDPEAFSNVPIESIKRTVSALLLGLCMTIGGFTAIGSNALSDSVLAGLMVHARMEKDSGRYGLALSALDSAMARAEYVRSRSDVATILVEKAYVEQVIGEYNKALSYLFKAQRIREDLQEREGMAEVYMSIGAIQQHQDNYPKAAEYYDKSLAIHKELGSLRDEAIAYNNFGSLYEDMGELELSLEYHERSLELWRDLGEQGWMGISHMHIGSCKEVLGLLKEARADYATSLELSGRNSPYINTLVTILMGQNYRASGRMSEALEWCRKGLASAAEMDIVPFQEKACDCLYKTYESLGQHALALEHYKRYVLLRDSIFGQENIAELTRIELNHSFEQKQLADSLQQASERLEVDLRYREQVAKERGQRNMAFISVVGILLLAGGLFSRLRFMRRSRAVIKMERDRSDELLLNILPKDVARELKEHGETMARNFDKVTVLFTDFKEFTLLSEQMGAAELVAEIHYCFTGFDAIVARHGIEKIKTFGDAYMAVGGLPDPRSGAPIDVVRAAMEMQEFLMDRRREREQVGMKAFEMRVGINTGPVVAGIVGVKKFQYDIWGDTVNIASRMESSGEVGEVNISQSTYALVSDEPELSFVPRGAIEVKGKGEMEMYFVQRNT